MGRILRLTLRGTARPLAVHSDHVVAVYPTAKNLGDVDILTSTGVVYSVNELFHEVEGMMEVATKKCLLDVENFEAHYDKIKD